VSLLKVGVVGVGHLGREHARVYRGMDGVKLVGVVDVNEGTARSVGRKLKTAWSTSPDVLFENVDAVSVAVPTVAHYAVALPFLERGLSVLVEKPMTFKVAEAEELVAVAAKTGAKLQVGHIERFNPAFQAIRELGLRPMFIECHRLSPFRFRSADVGVVFDLMIHDVDIIQHLFKSEIKRIDAVAVPVISAYEDIANARFVFENGCVANLTASRVSLKSLRKIRIFAPDCYLSIDTQRGEAVMYRKKAGFNEVAEKLKDVSNVRLMLEMRKVAYGDLVEMKKLKLNDIEPLQSELESFIAAVREDRAPVVPGEDGVKAVRVAAAVVADARKNLRNAGLDVQGKTPGE